MSGLSFQTGFLPPILVFCAASVVMVPLARRLGQSGIIGYLIAGATIGPFGLALIGDPATIHDVADLGVVLLLFIVGLELKLSRLVLMRKDIFGLGAAQMVFTTLVISCLCLLAGFDWKGSLAASLALSLSATAIALQMLNERSELSTHYGQKSFAVLLFQDLAFIPVLALIPLLNATDSLFTNPEFQSDGLIKAVQALGAVLFITVVGRFGLNPFFRLLAESGAREVMTAAALLVVLGAALLMESVGLSMAMGAFLAGILLAESDFRHQLEADIEPFRGILLGLFFISVGMMIDINLVKREWLILLLATPVLISLKISLATILMRFFGLDWKNALRAGALLSPAGEFTFVLLPVIIGLGLLDQKIGQILIALAVLTMLIGPLAAKGIDAILNAFVRSVEEPEPDDFSDSGETILVVGFGRFGQMVNQVLLSKNIDVTVIDKNVERIRGAARFGFKVYYGDGRRLDVLRAAGIEKATLLCLCIDDKETALKIIDLVHLEFPHVRTYVRAYDRLHSIELLKRDVHYQMRETFESALSFGQAALEGLGFTPEEAAHAAADVRQRDIVRLLMQKEEGLMVGLNLLRGNNLVKPEPLVQPKAQARGLNDETRDLIKSDR